MSMVYTSENVLYGKYAVIKFSKTMIKGYNPGEQMKTFQVLGCTEEEVRFGYSWIFDTWLHEQLDGIQCYSFLMSISSVDFLD